MLTVSTVYGGDPQGGMEHKPTSTHAHTGQDWKKLRSERKAQQRKWREEKLIEKLEKQQRQEHEKVKRLKEEEQQEEHRKAVGRHYSVSIALPGSILDNAQSPELRTYLAGQIARAAVIFNVDEVIIFDESGSNSHTTEGEFGGVGKKGNCNVQMARILQYLECPQYLRKAFFPQHPDLKFAGLLNPLDSPHHMRVEDRLPYREGVVLKVPVKDGKGSYVDAGLLKHVQIDKALAEQVRVTVKVDYEGEGKKKFPGKVVAPSAPREEAGLYWGYQVRLASCLSKVLTECPYAGGYDRTVGTSEKGDSVHQLHIPAFKHMLVVFGGVEGLETSLDTDPDLHLDDPRLLFDHYLNVCPQQGSGTIRTEEAVLITMATLQSHILNSAKSS